MHYRLACFKPLIGLEILNELPQSDKGGCGGVKFYNDKINNQEYFVFRVD
jgi:hypothetical protein